MNHIFANDRLRLSITDKCNFSCVYCSNEGQAHHERNFIQLDFLKKLIQKIIEEDIYIRKINITGGEPLLHPDLEEIVKLCLNVCSSITLNTNGSLLSFEKIDKLYNNGLTNIKFGIDSFKGESKPNIHSVNLKSESIIEKVIYASSLMPRSSVNIVLTDFNSKEFDETINIILTHKIDKVEFIQLINHEFRGKSYKIESGIQFEEIFSNYKHLFSNILYNKRLAKFICYTNEGLMIQFAEDFCQNKSCQNLWTRIDAKGRLMPCIKNTIYLPINLNEPLINQIEKCNSQMCNRETDFKPQKEGGAELPISELNWKFSFKQTDLDP